LFIVVSRNEKERDLRRAGCLPEDSGGASPQSKVSL
jgi:hypothetical protein